MHHLVHHLVNVMPQCMVPHSVRCTAQAAIAEFCPKSCDAAAIDFGCGIGKYLPLLASHTVRCLPPALYARALQALQSAIYIYALALYVYCIPSTHTLHMHGIRTAYMHGMHGTCRHVWWGSTSRVAYSLSRVRVVTPKGALHMHVMSMSMSRLSMSRLSMCVPLLIA